MGKGYKKRYFTTLYGKCRVKVYDIIQLDRNKFYRVGSENDEKKERKKF